MNRSYLSKHRPPLLLALSCSALLPLVGKGQLLDVSLGYSGKVNVTGAAATGSAADPIWNKAYAAGSFFNNTGSPGTASGMKYIDGSGSLSLTSARSNETSDTLFSEAGSNVSANPNLMSSPLAIRHGYDDPAGSPAVPLPSIAFTISGLTPNALFNLYTYAGSCSNYGSPMESFTAGGVTVPLSDPNNASTFAQGVNYALFTGVPSDASGNLTFTFNDTQVTTGSYALFDGFQLQQIPTLPSLLLLGGNSSYTGVSDPAHSLGEVSSTQTSFTSLPAPLSGVTFANGTPSGSLPISFGSSTTAGGSISWTTTPRLVDIANNNLGTGVFRPNFGGAEVDLASGSDLGIRVANLPAGQYDVYYVHSSASNSAETATINMGFNLTSLADPNGLSWTMTPNATAQWSAPLGPTQWDSSSNGNNCVRQRIQVTDPSSQVFTLATENTSNGMPSKLAGLEFVAISNQDFASMLGDSAFTPTDSPTVVSQKINALRSAGVTYARVSLTPSQYYTGPNNTAGVSPGTQTMINHLVAQGITPYIEFEFYGYWYYNTPSVSILSYDWTAIGSAFASYFGTTVLHYCAINEPDMYGHEYSTMSGYGPMAFIPTADYATALGNLATGIHSIVPNAKVIPGGYGYPAAFGGAGSSYYACAGYPGAIKALLQSGALSGIDLHNYWNFSDTPSYSATSQEYEFQQVKSVVGLGDIDIYCTEFNTCGSGVPEATAAQHMLTLMWSILSCTKNDNVTPNSKLALAYSLTREDGDFVMDTALSPWTPNLRGVTYQLVAQLTSAMQFVPGSITKGGCVMSGPNKRLWVIHNISTWVTTPSANYTCTSIPPNATRLLRYGYDGLRETVTVAPGATSYNFTDIPTGETTMVEALP